MVNEEEEGNLTTLRRSFFSDDDDENLGARVLEKHLASEMCFPAQINRVFSGGKGVIYRSDLWSRQRLRLCPSETMSEVRKMKRFFVRAIFLEKFMM